MNDTNLEKTETIMIDISEPSYDIHMANVIGLINIIDDDDPHSE